MPVPADGAGYADGAETAAPMPIQCGTPPGTVAAALPRSPSLSPRIQLYWFSRFTHS